jgi:hypothetical protein
MTCRCRQCLRESGEKAMGWPQELGTAPLAADANFIVCAICGNKRCPHANDHRHPCTGSNEPGQKGSAYE